VHPKVGSMVAPQPAGAPEPFCPPTSLFYGIDVHSGCPAQPAWAHHGPVVIVPVQAQHYATKCCVGAAHRLQRRPKHGPTCLFHAWSARSSPVLRALPDAPKSALLLEPPASHTTGARCRSHSATTTRGRGMFRWGASGRGEGMIEQCRVVDVKKLE
jgi:hypothetical protein